MLLETKNNDIAKLKLNPTLNFEGFPIKFKFRSDTAQWNKSCFSVAFDYR